MESKITVVIPYRERKGNDNLRMATESLRYYRQTSVPAVTVIASFGADAPFVEEGAPADTNLKVKLYGPDGDFTRCRAINAGAEEVKTELMCILDADCSLSPCALADAQANVEKTGGLVGAPHFLIQPDGTSRRYPYNTRMVTGGFQVFKTEDFRAVGGYNPFMMKWGFEDLDFVSRIRNLGRQISYLPYPYFHHWHEPAQDPEGEQENLKISQTSKWTGEKWVRTDMNMNVIEGEGE